LFVLVHGSSKQDGHIGIISNELAIKFNEEVGMGACTYIIFRKNKLKALPVLQSDFQLPFLDTWELGRLWWGLVNDKRGICALQVISSERIPLQYS